MFCFIKTAQTSRKPLGNVCIESPVQSVNYLSFEINPVDHFSWWHAGKYPFLSQQLSTSLPPKVPILLLRLRLWL